MIKKLLSFALVAVTISVNAQQLIPKHGNHVTEAVTPSSSMYRLGGNNQVLSTTDTLFPASIMPGGCAVGTNTTVSGFSLYYMDNALPIDSGWIYGTNIFYISGFSTTEFAQKYASGTAGLSVTDVLLWSSNNHGNTATTVARIYDEDLTAHAPNNLLGTSNTANLSSFVSTAYNKYTFATPVAVSPNINFFVSVSTPAYGGADQDSMAIVSTKYNCESSPDSSVWMNISPLGWYSSLYVYGINPDLMIWPVVSIPTTGIAAYTKGSLSLYAASPNPANNTVNINFSLNNAAKVDIEVIDVTGKVVRTIKGAETFASNTKHTVSVDVSNLESGSYFYSINANGTKLFSKFVIAK